MRLLAIPWISRTRQNHALEHATIHLLNRRYPSLQLVGWSTPQGFYVHGDVPTSAVQAAVTEAAERLRHGESHLAIHPRCGTNLVTGGALAGLAAFLTMLPGSNRSRRERLPMVILVTTLALVLSQPLGVLVQKRLTTDAIPSAITLTQVEQSTVNNHTVHLVRTTVRA